MDLAQTKPNIIQPLYALFKQYHGHKYPSEFYEEILVLQATGKVKEDALVQNARDYTQQLIKSLYENPEDNSALRHYCYYLLQRQADKAKQQQAHWSSLWAILKQQLHHHQEKEEARPAWINMQMATPFLLQQGDETQWHVIQQGEKLCLLNNNQIEVEIAKDNNATLQFNISNMFQFSSSTSFFLDQRQNNKQWDVFDYQLDKENKTELPLVLEHRRIHANGKAYNISPIKKPDWAESIGHDSQGLYIEYRLAKQHYHSYWQNPEIDNIGHWQGLPPAQIGKDQYGTYADLSLKSITQRFRYIEAGTFLMGSPENERERELWEGSKETQHQVTLTQGFWMADTAVTQAFYFAVMGDNPSNFKENENNPVEEVSWDDVQIFIKKLNQLFPDLQAALPSEAQWEYACRAGTTSPFSFGDNITPDQVNYDGNFPYADGEEGLFREKTIPVKSLPVNDWGLYEMHGNVWEWCQDAFKKDLGKQLVQDPLEARGGAERVVRGGSWFSDGGGVRSADRSRYTPDFRNYVIGFRLLLGHLSYRPVKTGKEPFEPQHEQMLRDETADHAEEQMAGLKVKTMLKNIKGFFK